VTFNLASICCAVAFNATLEIDPSSPPVPNARASSERASRLSSSLIDFCNDLTAAFLVALLGAISPCFI